MIEAMVQSNPYQPWSDQKSIIVFDKSLVEQERIEADEYGNFKRKKEKKLGNFLKGQIENENLALMIRIIKKYNEEMN
jgi:hypothetical protein